jgi:hypothetical protein
MATGEKISALDTTTAQSTDLIPIARDGANYNITPAGITALVDVGVTGVSGTAPIVVEGTTTPVISFDPTTITISATTPLTGAEIVAINQDGDNKQTTIANILNPTGLTLATTSLTGNEVVAITQNNIVKQTTVSQLLTGRNTGPSSSQAYSLALPKSDSRILADIGIDTSVSRDLWTSLLLNTTTAPTNTLSGSLTASGYDTNITLNDASAFPSVGRIQIGSEIITYTQNNGNTLSGGYRGAYNTTPAIASSGAIVTSLVNWTFNKPDANTSVSSTGFIAGTGNNYTGRVYKSNVYTYTGTPQGTVFMTVQKTAIANNGVVNSNSGGTYGNTTNQFFDSVGNPYATDFDYSPVLFSFWNSAGNRAVIAQVSPTSGFIIRDWDNSGGGQVYANLGSSVILNNVRANSPNQDSTYWDVVFTWKGTTCSLYVDGVLVSTVTNTNGALPTDILAGTVAVGNFGPFTSPALGGNLGPYTVQRFQLSTAYTEVNTLPITIGIYGDSYGVGSGTGLNGGDGGIPQVATITSIDNAQAMMNIATTGAGLGNVYGQISFGHLLQSYARKQLGVSTIMYGACKNGWANYITKYVNPMVSTEGGSTVYADALNAALPSIVILIDTVNNQLQCPDATAATLAVVNDLKLQANYFAKGNKALRAIIIMEACTLQYLASNTGALTPAQCATFTAACRTQLRAAFYDQVYYADNRVPVTYVKTYESMFTGSNAAYSLWGSYVGNTITNTAQIGPGPSSTAPDVHLSPTGRILYSDLIWSILKPILQTLIPVANTGAVYVGQTVDGTLVTSITPNCAQSGEQQYTISATTCTINAPVNPPNVGARLSITLIKGTASAITLTWVSAYRNMPTWSAGASGTRATAEFRYDGVSWQYVGGSTAFA